MGYKWTAEKFRCQEQLVLSLIYCLGSEGERDGNTAGKAGLRKPLSQQLNPLPRWKTAPGLEVGQELVTERGIPFIGVKSNRSTDIC